MLFRPERYAPKLEIKRDYATLLKGIEQKLTKGDWAVINAFLGEYDLRVETAGLNEASVHEILAHLTWSHQLHASRPDREGWIRILEFDNADAPYRYLELLEEGQEAMAKARSSPTRPWSVTVTPYDGIEGEAAIRRVIAPVGAHASAVEHQSVWVVRGKRLVVVNVRGFRPGLRIDWTLNEVYARLDALEEAK